MLALVLAGCAHAPKPAPGVAPTIDGGWKNLRAEHRVTVDVTLDGGKHEQRKLRGAIAVERPGRFRLRALGPGGIALFDLLYKDGKVKVLQAIKDPASSALGPVIEALAGDLQASFNLEPAPEDRTLTIEKDHVIVREKDRTVKLSSFASIQGRAVPLRIEVDNRARHYQVTVDASDVEVDTALDPALFSD
jgi:outer membrane lipoprotein-sorting protein